MNVHRVYQSMCRVLGVSPYDNGGLAYAKDYTIALTDLGVILSRRAGGQERFRLELRRDDLVTSGKPNDQDTRILALLVAELA